MRSLPPFLVSIGLLLTFCSCSSSSQQQQLGQNSKGTDVLNGKSSSISFPVSYPAEVDSNQFQPEKVAESQFVSENQTFVLKNSAPQYTYQFTFQLKSVAVSKKLTGFQKANIDYSNEKTDASGNLTSADSYVYLDFKVKNMLSSEAKICLGNVEIISLSGDNTVNVKLGSRLYAFDKPQHDKNSRAFNEYKFRANEETT